MTSTAETLLAVQLEQAGILFDREYRFHPTRRWRFDFSVDHHRPLAVEVEGGGYVRGRHTRGLSFEHDCEKYNEAMILGWRVLRVTPAQVEDGRALAWIQRALA